MRRNYTNNTIRFTPDLFYDAIEYFKNLENLYSGSCLGVTDESGELELILEYIDNNSYMDLNEETHIYKWFYNKRNAGSFDVTEVDTILNGRNIAVFEQINEYTVQFAKILLLLKKQYPNLKLYFMDKRAIRFFDKDEVEILSDNIKMPDSEAYIMVMSERYKTTVYKSTNIRTTYKSTEIMMRLYKKEVETLLKPEIIKYCESEMPEQFRENKKILGVIARGTDYSTTSVMARTGKDIIWNATVEQLIEVTKEKLAKEQYDYLYLATEDNYNYTKYKEAFGDMVIARDQERIDYKKNEQYVKKFVTTIPKQKSLFEHSLDYLVVLRSLSCCDSLLSTMVCGMSTAAIGLNGKKYKNVTIIKRS